jgi:hypothetical protein
MKSESIQRANRAIAKSLAEAHVSSRDLFAPAIPGSDGYTGSQDLRALLAWCERIASANPTIGASIKHIADDLRAELRRRGEDATGKHADADAVELHDLCINASGYIASAYSNRPFLRADDFVLEERPSIERARALATRLRGMALQDATRSLRDRADSHEALARDLDACIAKMSA